VLLGGVQLGMLIFEMLVGRPAFSTPDQSMNVTYMRVLEATVVFPLWITDDAKHIIRRLLDKDAATRLGAHGRCAPSTRLRRLRCPSHPPAQPTGQQWELAAIGSRALGWDAAAVSP
jgi:serine/threonine protein kinase